MKWTNAKAVGANIPSRPRRFIPAQARDVAFARGLLWGLVFVAPFWLIVCGVAAYLWTR